MSGACLGGAFQPMPAHDDDLLPLAWVTDARRTRMRTTAIAALADGYRVFFVSDCSGGLTVESHEDAKRRLVQAGATPINWVGVVCEWAPDFTSNERHKFNPAVMKNGAGVGLALEQAFAQR